ncbi:hypothetical protein EAG_03015 [Camponotus floridanus]|uniref:B box-type domain-containing protein n=1 Tax=Camponotus floridanus TaxID=104421 RepID=E2ARL1_CAMFO|nr:hypothetical protein EAG_03015 [Camponotus floridanus]
MYPYIRDVSRAEASRVKSPPSYSIPSTRLKNVTCVACKHKFYVPGCCYECGNQANVNCPQCLALYCHCCYSKIHGRALQSHTQVPIYEGDPNTPAAILNSCSPTCHETLNYFCNDCNVACCSNCTLRSHKMHDFVELSEKNQTLLPEFNQVYTNIEETLLRVSQTKKVSTYFSKYFFR